MVLDGANVVEEVFSSLEEDGKGPVSDWRCKDEEEIKEKICTVVLGKGGAGVDNTGSRVVVAMAGTLEDDGFDWDGSEASGVVSVFDIAEEGNAFDGTDNTSMGLWAVSVVVTGTLEKGSASDTMDKIPSGSCPLAVAVVLKNVLEPGVVLLG